MFQQRPQSSVISSPLAIALSSVMKELLDSLLAEFLYCHAALSHPLVERSQQAESVGDGSSAISLATKRGCEPRDVGVQWTSRLSRRDIRVRFQMTLHIDFLLSV
jgi:hypothetical protein